MRGEIKTYSFDGGYIAYRLPNLPEATILLGRLGFSRQSDTNAKLVNDQMFVLIGQLMQHIGDFIVDLKVTLADGTALEGRASLDDALFAPEFYKPIADVSSEFLMLVIGMLNRDVTSGNSKAAKAATDLPPKSQGKRPKPSVSQAGRSKGRTSANQR